MTFDHKHEKSKVMTGDPVAHENDRPAAGQGPQRPQDEERCPGPHAVGLTQAARRIVGLDGAIWLGTWLKPEHVKTLYAANGKAATVGQVLCRTLSMRKYPLVSVEGLCLGAWLACSPLWVLRCPRSWPSCMAI